MTMQRFKTIVAKAGSRAYIAIPFNPNEVWGVKQRHHITGTVNGCRVRGALGSDGSQHFLPLGAVWRRDNGVEAGAEVEVVLTPEGPQTDTLPIASPPRIGPGCSRTERCPQHTIGLGAHVA